MRFCIKLLNENKYIWTEIDSGGMSAWLSPNKDDADTWGNIEGAEKFVKRLAKPASKFRNDKFEVIRL